MGLRLSPAQHPLFHPEAVNGQPSVAYGRPCQAIVPMTSLKTQCVYFRSAFASVGNAIQGYAFDESNGASSGSIRWIWCEGTLSISHVEYAYYLWESTRSLRVRLNGEYEIKEMVCS